MVKISLTRPRKWRCRKRLFATRLYKAPASRLARGLEKTCLAIAAEDQAGRRWSRDHGYGGYTSYASLNDLTRRASIFADLERAIARHVAAFAREAAIRSGRPQAGAGQSLDQCDGQGRGAYARTSIPIR